MQPERGNVPVKLSLPLVSTTIWSDLDELLTEFFEAVSAGYLHRTTLRK